MSETSAQSGVMLLAEVERLRAEREIVQKLLLAVRRAKAAWRGSKSRATIELPLEQWLAICDAFEEIEP